MWLFLCLNWLRSGWAAIYSFWSDYVYQSTSCLAVKAVNSVEVQCCRSCCNSKMKERQMWETGLLLLATCDSKMSQLVHEVTGWIIHAHVWVCGRICGLNEDRSRSFISARHHVFYWGWWSKNRRAKFSLCSVAIGGKWLLNFSLILASDIWGSIGTVNVHRWGFILHISSLARPGLGRAWYEFNSTW